MFKDKNRILVLIPGKNARGGITTYYQTLMPLFTLPVDFLERGARNWPVRNSFIKESKRIIRDYYLFFKTVNTGKYTLVITNTSFSSLAIIRDGLYLLIARIYKLKTITFFRGWDYKFSERVKNSYLSIFRFVYFKSDAIIDLAQKNIDILKEWGYKKQVYLETVAVEGLLLDKINEEYLREKIYSKNINILFLARLEKSKGIFEAIDAFAILKNKYSNIIMTIAGDGFEYYNVFDYLNSKSLDNVTLTNFIEFNQKRDVFVSADIYLLPSYSEGMPSSLIEAMAFGLPVVTRPVGGISDFFVNGINGYMTESLDPAVFATLIESIFFDPDKMRRMALNNYRYAKAHFYSDKVIERVEEILLKVIIN